MIQKTIQFVKLTLEGAESGHDYFHIERVLKLSETIANQEIALGKQVNFELVQLGALLHDIADQKFHGGDDSVGPRKAREFLSSIEVEEATIKNVEYIINNISYKGAKVENKMQLLEGLIVQDADRIDALGAIGIARCFTYGGYKNRILYDPDQKPILHENYQQYKNSTSTTINHFYEKLLLLKDMMNTESGKAMALKRHQFMEQFLNQFHQEWQGII